MGRTSRGSRTVCMPAGSLMIRMFFLACNTSSASASKSGATTTSVKTSLTISAIALVTGRFVAMTPP